MGRDVGTSPWSAPAVEWRGPRALVFVPQTSMVLARAATCRLGHGGVTGIGWSTGEGARLRAHRKVVAVSESLIAGGWRVGDGAALEFAGEPLEYKPALVSPRQRYRRGALVRRALLVADIAGLVLAFVLANVLLPSV